MGAALWKDRWLLGLNGLAVVAYLAASSLVWIDPSLPPEERSLPGAPLIFFFFAVPILAIAGALDLAWLVWRVEKSRRTGAYGFWLPLCLLVVCWISAHLFNRIMLANP